VTRSNTGLFPKTTFRSLSKEKRFIGTDRQGNVLFEVLNQNEARERGLTSTMHQAAHLTSSLFSR
jgi:hypothetical protein